MKFIINEDEVNKIRLISSDTYDVCEYFMSKFIKQSVSLGHDMSVAHWSDYNLLPLSYIHSHCKKCCFEIEVEIGSIYKQLPKLYTNFMLKNCTNGEL